MLRSCRVRKRRQARLRWRFRKDKTLPGPTAQAFHHCLRRRRLRHLRPHSLRQRMLPTPHRLLQDWERRYRRYLRHHPRSPLRRESNRHCRSFRQRGCRHRRSWSLRQVLRPRSCLLDPRRRRCPPAPAPSLVDQRGHRPSTRKATLRRRPAKRAARLRSRANVGNRSWTRAVFYLDINALGQCKRQRMTQSSTCEHSRQRGARSFTNRVSACCPPRASQTSVCRIPGHLERGHPRGVWTGTRQCWKP